MVEMLKKLYKISIKLKEYLKYFLTKIIRK